MSISVACTACGKSLKVKDEWAGKKAKCPGCGESFVVGASAGTARGPTKFDPAKSGKKDKGAGIAVNWGKVGLLGGVLLVAIIMGVYFVGQSGAKRAWAEMIEKAEDDTNSVITKAIQARMSASGEYNPRKPHNIPNVQPPIHFVWDLFALSLPEAIPFHGTSSVGQFKGKFNTRTQEVDADVELGGMRLVTGVEMSKSTEKVHVTGRRKDGNTLVEIDGKVAELVYPKDPDADDEPPK